MVIPNMHFECLGMTLIKNVPHWILATESFLVAGFAVFYKNWKAV